MLLGTMLSQYAQPTGTAPSGIVGQIVSLYPRQNDGILAFEPGNDIPLAVAVTVGGTPTDPPALTLKLDDPTGARTTQTYPGSITHDGTGLLHYDLQGASGTWIVEWDCPALECGTGPIEFVILPAIP
jgi:hypothetical protein